MRKKCIIFSICLVCISAGIVSFITLKNNQKNNNSYSLLYNGCTYRTITEEENFTSIQKNIMEQYGISNNTSVDEDMIGEYLADNEYDTTYYSVKGFKNNDIIITCYHNNGKHYYFAIKDTTM